MIRVIGVKGMLGSELCRQLKKNAISFNLIKKSLFIFIVTILCSIYSFAENFKIASIDYSINGSTKEEHLSNKIKIDTEHVFNTEDELKNYINEIVQKYTNLRVFESVSINYRIDNSTTEAITPVTLSINVSDSKNFVIVPYYKYDSNDGHVIKGKIQDSNFLGTLNEASGDIYFAIDPKDNSSTNFSFGASFAYDYPFYIGIVDAAWNNDLDFSYTIGKDSPEWKVCTGFTFKIPFDSLSLVLTLTQSFVNDFDYAIYNDSLYFGEEADFSIPIILDNIPNWGDIVYTPGVNFTYNWSDHELNTRNDDLLSPELLFYNKLSTSNINWKGNFRKGLSFYAKPQAGYNFHINDMVIGIDSELQFFDCWKYAGINTRLYGFSYINKNITIGSRLRGIRDEEYYNNSGFSDINSTSTPAAIVLNLDIPIHIVTFDFSKSKSKLMKNLGLELQIAPFIDFALTHNRVTNRTFDIKDSYLCGGVEFIVFPEKFKSLQIRASAGFDLTRTLLKGVIDDNWRPNVSPYELSLGLGLHY